MTRALCVLLATFAVAVGNPLCCVFTDCCHTAAQAEAERETPSCCSHCKKKESTPAQAGTKAPCQCADKTSAPRSITLELPTLELIAGLSDAAPAVHATSVRMAIEWWLATPEVVPAHVSLPLLL